MEYNPEYYKEQADRNKEIYEEIEAKKNRTRSDDKRIQQLKKQEATYRKMYAKAIIQKERLQRIQRIQQERQAEPPKKSKVISMLKENEAKKKQQKLMNKLLESGIPTNEDVREDAAKLGIDIDENLDDKNVEDELAELGGPDDFDLPEVPSHPIEIGKKPNKVNPSVPPPPPPLTDEYNEDNLPIVDESINAGPFDDDPDIVERPEEIGQQLLNIKNEDPIKSTVKPSVKGLSPPNPPLQPPRQDVKPRPVSSANSNQPELINFPPPPPPLQAPKEDNKPSRKTKKVRLGFSETLKNQTEKRSPLQRKSTKVCEDIFINGSKVTKKYFYPSEFPKLTKIKPITVTMKKGGKRKTRKLIK